MAHLTSPESSRQDRCLGEGLDPLLGGEGKTRRPAAFKYVVIIYPMESKINCSFYTQGRQC